jgi:glycosyltransferase involved in cell wall biosynthesis
MRISLVTPTYQQAATLRETIQSVLGQSYDEIEYWVIDAGSRDGTLDILRDYEHDARFHWVSEPDRGQSDAINKGLARCTGAIFNWINSDDYLVPGALARVAAEFAVYPGTHLVSGRTAEFRGRPSEVFNHVELQLRATAEQSITVGVYNQPGTFWRTDIFRGLGGVDPALHYVMDWDLWVRYLARHGQADVRRIRDVLAYYRHHAEAKTSAAPSAFYDESKVVFHNLHLTLHAPAPYLLPEAEQLKSWHRCDFELAPRFNRERYLGAYAERMVRTYRRRDPAQARAWLARAWSHRPWVTPWRLKMAARALFWR